MGGRGYAPRQVGNPELRAARLRRGWTEDDVAVALHRLAAELGEPAPGVDANHVSKWERGARTPSRFYRPRLCLVFETTPERIGLAPTPRLLQDVDELVRRRDATGQRARGDDRERLEATLRHLWPVDPPLLAALARAERSLAARTDSGPPAAVLPDLQRYLDELHVLLGRSQSTLAMLKLKLLGSRAAYHAGFLLDNVGRPRDGYAMSAEAEALAREANDGNTLAEVLVDRAERLSLRASGPEALAAPIALTDAAVAAMDPQAPPGVRGWVHGQAAADLAAQGDDVQSGRRLDEAYRAAAGADDLNLFSDLSSAWLESYRGLRALHLGHGAEAMEVFERVLAATDPRLHWERSRGLYRLAWALALQDEVERASDLLRDAVDLTASNGDRQGLAAVVHVRERQLGRWRTATALRRLDEAIRAAQRSA